MKTLLTYYSFSGNTDRVAKIFSDVLKSKGEVLSQRLKPNPETKNFIAQCLAARRGDRPELEGDVKYDAKPYDVVVVGGPVWAFKPVPAVNSYLDKVGGLSGKRAIVLLTSGSGAGVGKCFANIHKTLDAKGVKKIDEINIPDYKQKDESFIRQSIERVL